MGDWDFGALEEFEDGRARRLDDEFEEVVFSNSEVGHFRVSCFLCDHPLCSAGTCEVYLCVG